jgi:hypothetical protein
MISHSLDLHPVRSAKLSALHFLAAIWSYSIYLPLVVFWGFATVGGWFHPQLTADAIPYVGAALSLDEPNAILLHHQVYGLLKRTSSPEDYITLTEDGPIVKDMAESPKQFMIQASVRFVKPLYIGLIYCAYRAGLNPFLFTKGFSIICCLAISFILFSWLRRYFSEGASIFFSVTLLIASSFYDLIGLTSPDLLSALIIIGIAYIYSMYGHKVSISMLLVTLVLVRADNFLFALGYFGITRFSARESISYKELALTSVTISVIMLAVQTHCSYDWQTYWFKSFIDRTVDLSVPHHLTVLQYIRTILFSLRLKPPCNIMAFFFFLEGIALMASRGKNLRSNRLSQLSILLLLSLISHWLVFPEPVPRFFLAHYLVIGVFFLERMGNLLSNQQAPLPRTQLT